jgi:hypothetical protein
MPRKNKPVVESLVWSKSKDRYERNNRPVSDGRLADIVHGITQNAGNGVERLTEKLVSGEIDLPAWQVEMRDHIRNGHRAMAILAYGGKENLGAREWGRVGAVVRKQNGYFDNFANQIENGDVPVGPGLIARARLYMEALYATHANLVADRRAKSGKYQQARRILGATDRHCPECPPLAAAGWMPIEEMTPIGATVCRVRCRCRIQMK